MSSQNTTISGKVLGSVSGLPPEIWTMIGDEIQGVNNLRALVRVCCAFRDIFTPALYGRTVLKLSNYQPDKIHSEELKPQLVHTKHFEVRVEEFMSRERSYDVAMNDQYATFVARMLKAMPNLRSFSWYDSPHEDHIPSLMLRNKTLIDALKSRTLLSHLYVSFDYQWTDEEEQSLNCSIPLAGFRNLTSLELYNIGGKEVDEIQGITQALSSSPHLRKLGLGLGWRTDCEGIPEILLIRGEGDFLLDLCSRYHSLGMSPLKLETLRLGHGVFPCSDKPNTGNFLANLVDMSGLKTLHLFNGLVRGHDDEDTYLNVNWTLFDACICLRQLAVSRLGPALRLWLNLDNISQSVEELIVTDHYPFHSSELKEFDSLRLPKLSYVFTREVTVGSEPDEWSDTDSEFESEADSELSSDSEADSQDSNEDDPREESERMALAKHPLSGSKTITVLDRLYDGGVNLKRLGICLDLDTSWGRFKDHLRTLSQLTQLRLNSKSVRSGGYPSKQSSLWPDAKRPREIALEYAKLIKVECSSLQYLQIGQWVWRFTNSIGTHLHHPDQVELRKLEYDELMSIELFAMNTFASESGLPEPETEHEEISDEEEDRMERMLAEIGLAYREGRSVDPSRFEA
ncbi:hypothetical protein BKA65DRAFT_506760 [Rhexocercosporidium sp. MPI-PUGE-AT-0058]|nr:hypothetical protein BKA65DRAFT_506760 [Rhexocercosporidium sp. MPI-PUGE-AT-0058]